tara:strand:- start:205598 stop:206410 length:813 start_codon:yes stop_codon:yes gene_type:complete
MNSAIIQIGLGALIASSVLLWRNSDARACSRDSRIGISLESVLPLDGSAAPPNTKIWVGEHLEFDYVPAELTGFTLHRDTEELTFTVSTLNVAGEISRQIWGLDPDENLEHGDVIAVHYQGQPISEFRIEGEELLEAPAAPVLQSLDVSSSYFGAFFCGEPSEAKVTVASAQALVLLFDARRSDPATSALAVGSGFTATAIDLPDGALEMRMAVMDLAGNRSAVVPLPATSVPPEVSGCSMSGARADSFAWYFFAVLLLLRRRSRLRSIH